ncbi:MAG: tetratricopeptide repeat protein [Planctomycetota bacterium]
MDSTATAGRKLEHLARKEVGAPRSPIDAPIPPGVTPQALAPGQPGEPRARLPLEMALGEIKPLPAMELAPPSDPPDLDDATRDTIRDQALRHYARGRDAAINGEQLTAIIELENALALDPTSPAVLRQLARSYLSMRNSLKATRHYERLLAVEPDDSESLFMLGLTARSRRDFEQSASYLARPRLRGTSFDHDPAAGILADFWLGTALRHLGYDQAWIELATEVAGQLAPHMGPTLYVGQYQQLYIRRAEIWREIGDAQCRLGAYGRALDAYRVSARLPNAEPESLHPRLVYANLRLGRVRGAQAKLLEALAGGAGTVTERDIRLCGYVAQNTSPLDLLAEAAVERHRAEPDDAGLVRAAAVLLPRAEAVELLRAFLDRRPADLDVLSQLLAWLASHDERSAVDLTVALAEAHPALASDYGDRLARVGRRTGTLLDQAESLPASPARAVVTCRLLVYIGGLGEAWRICADGIDRWPDDQALRLQQIDLAGRLEEPQLLEAAVEASARPDDAGWWLARARANLAADRRPQAVRAAAEAVRLQPRSAEALTELAKAHVAHAERSRDAAGRRQHADDAVVAAEEAIRLDPRRDDAYAVLLGLYTPGGVFGDASRQREVRTVLRKANPKSRLLANLDAQEDLRRGRVERGLQRLVVLCDADPTDVLSLELAVAAWVQTDREDEALEWFDRKLGARPGDPVLLGQWVTLMLQADRSGEAIRRLKGVLAEEPAHDAARRILETLYRRGGRQADALPLGEQRLLSRPPGIRRELELAAMYAGVGRDDEAVEHLGWVLEHADAADFDHLVTALGVAGRMSDRDAQYDLLTLTIAERTVQQFPDAPLQVYGTALRALARLDRIDQHFDDLADRAVRYARGASGASIQDADVWRQLAQALVNAEQADAAARALRVRLWAEAALDPPARVLLVRAVLTSDAAANRVEATIDLVNRLALRGWLPPTPGEESEPTVSDVLYETSIVYALLGREASAERLLREAVRLEPDHPMALNNLGYTRVEQDDADEQTEAWITRALELRPDDNNVLDSMGWLRYKQGRFTGDEQTPGAVELIRESLARDSAARDQAEPAAPEVLDHLGDTLWRLGDHEAASDAWRRAIEILEDAEWQQRRGQEYVFFQARIWGLLVSEPGEIHERQYGVLLENAREKLRIAEQGGTPPVATTFEELGEAGSSGEDNDGRP